MNNDTTTAATVIGHVRDQHTVLGDPNTWGREERIAARDTCGFCRVMFRETGEFRAAHGEDHEFGGQYSGGPMRSIGARPVRRSTLRPASEKQVAFLDKLLSEKEHTYTADDVANAKGDIKDCSNMIDHLLDAPRKRVAPVEAPTTAPVANGRYAIEEDGELHFFKVDSPEKGQWVGYTFVQIQASDDLYPVKGRARKARILEAIAVDPRAAMIRYGRELGVCGDCGRTLTDEASRAAGIGPICASK